MDRAYLRNHLNNFVGEGYGHIPRWAARIYGNAEWIELREAFREWQDAGFLEILRDPEQCADDDIILRMLNFIDATEPMPTNWISYERRPPLYVSSREKA